MVVKNIAITEEAYNSLKHLKREDQSFSKVILSLTTEKKGDLMEVFGILKGKEGDELAKRVKENRKKFNEDFERRAREMFRH